MVAQDDFVCATGSWNEQVSVLKEAVDAELAIEGNVRTSVMFYNNLLYSNVCLPMAAHGGVS